MGGYSYTFMRKFTKAEKATPAELDMMISWVRIERGKREWEVELE